jgi:hypothetical protein
MDSQKTLDKNLPGETALISSLATFSAVSDDGRNLYIAGFLEALEGKKPKKALRNRYRYLLKTESLKSEFRVWNEEDFRLGIRT